MLRNYLKIAIRSLLKHKLYSGINVFGLALGMACALLIGLWVKAELSYNRFLPDAESICFVRVNFTNPHDPSAEVATNFVTPGPLQDAIASDVSEVAATVKMNYGPEYLIKVGDKASKEKGHFATDDFFGVFDLPVIAGNPKAALKQPNQIIITRQVAEKFFPKGEAIGQKLQLNNDKYYVVGAVIDNLPANSSLQFGWLVNWKEQAQDWMKTWGNNSFMTYIRLKPHTTLAQAEAAMSTIYPRHAGKNFETGRPTLQPITDLHLHGEYKNGKSVGGRIEYVRVFSLVALFILLIACVNFMNLATARSATRAKEVGVRKVVGALRSSLAGQFISESVLTSLLAAILSLGLVWLVLPSFNAVSGTALSLDLTDPILWFIVLGLTVATGMLSGSYPAFFLSSLQPIKILKGRLQVGTGPALFRRVLVVFQFSLSAFLIVGMLAVGRQMDYLRTKNLGLDRENVLYWPIEGFSEAKQYTAFQNEVIRLPSIASATTAGSLPVDVQGASGDLQWQGKDPHQDNQIFAMFVGSDFTRTMSIKLAGGRDFQTSSPADSSSYIINEATARLISQSFPGMKGQHPESMVGKEVQFWKGKGRIVGVMKDFHLQSLHESIKPLILCFDYLNTSYLLVKTRPGQTQQAITDLQKLSKTFNPNYPFNFHFLDEEYERLYRAEQQVHTLVNYFGILAILISCLGLFGLAAFTAEQRTKEIGVRKVLGASVGSIVTLLSTDFLKLVMVALVLASPLAWWALTTWLNTFAYHDSLSWSAFALAGLLAILIAFVTVSYQSIRAALVNPVKSLRSE